VTVARPALGVGTIPAGHYHFTGALRSEWTKIRSVRSTAWALAALVVLGIGIGILATSSQAATWRHGGIIQQALFDPTSVSLTGLLFGQLAVGVLGVLVMSAEYGTGTIRASLAAIPRRPVVLVAKLAVFAAVVLVVSEAVSFAAFFIGQAILSGRAPTASLSEPGVARAVVGGGLYLTMLGIIALGLATIVRHTAGSIAVYVTIQLILPLVVSAFPAKYGHPVGRYLPAVIGSSMTATTPQGAHAEFLPSFPPWTGFGLLCLYGALAMVVGAVLMVRRDA
jgi:ABC-2 type transport system permease protein